MLLVLAAAAPVRLFHLDARGFAGRGRSGSGGIRGRSGRARRNGADVWGGSSSASRRSKRVSSGSPAADRRWLGAFGLESAYHVLAVLEVRVTLTRILPRDVQQTLLHAFLLEAMGRFPTRRVQVCAAAGRSG